MRLFAFELKKIWLRPTIFMLLVLGLLTFVTILYPVIRSYNNYSGVYGDYKTELFLEYGETLEPEEYAEIDIPGKIAELREKAQAIINDDPLYAKYEIYSIEDMNNFNPYEYIQYDEPISESEQQQRNMDFALMQQKLYSSWYINAEGEIIFTENFSGPIPRIMHWETISSRYAHLAGGKNPVEVQAQYSESSVVQKQAEKFIESYNSNLIRYDLTNNFSMWATLICIFAVIAVVLLTAPTLVNDRSQGLHYIQYSASAGRKTLKTQFVAAAFSSVILGAAVVGAAYAAYFGLTDSGLYWNAHIADYSGTFFMYNITLSQYVFILGGMTILLCAATGCFAFMMARYSANIVTLMIKAVPIAAAISGAAFISMYGLLSSDNILFHDIFRGNIEFTEFILCGFIWFFGIIAAGLIVRHERRVDVV